MDDKVEKMLIDPLMMGSPDNQLNQINCVNKMYFLMNDVFLTFLIINIDREVWYR